VALVDYAHTPDALERVLKSLRPLVKGRIICVFGCGGDRDRTKRPLMGEIAQSLSDKALVTSDNPRTEEPLAIIRDITERMEDKSNVVVIPDRAQAIRHCLGSLEPGDCGVVAGKGHEDYQIVGTQRNHFSDREQIHEWIKENR
jgi:UDP-N-acetylmuramoyl-L-alanyl-D-glutamate--2,6-diaminopimelate ligase